MIAKTTYSIVDSYTEEELRQMVSESTSMRELCRKIGYTCNGNNNITVQKRLDYFNISTEHFTGLAKDYEFRTVETVFCENSTVTQHTLRRWYEKGNYKNYQCEICGQEPFWNNQPLTLTLDHINGNNHDNRLENLRWICPNCDRQLPTFAGSNVKKKRPKKPKVKKINIYNNRRPPKKELHEKLINSYGNFTKVAAEYHVSDNAVRKWCRFYNIPFHSKDYKK